MLLQKFRSRLGDYPFRDSIRKNWETSVVILMVIIFPWSIFEIIRISPGMWATIHVHSVLRITWYQGRESLLSRKGMRKNRLLDQKNISYTVNGEI